MMQDSTAGMFLVATPMVGGAPFWQSVILVMEHDESGAVGLVLTAPTESDVSQHIPGVADLATAPGVVFVGGPVQTDMAIILARSRAGRFIRPPTLGDVGMIDPEDVPADVSDLRVFAGYAGWDGGQLDEELTEGAWWVRPSVRTGMFTPNPETLWADTVGASPGTIPFHRTFPTDPATN